MFIFVIKSPSPSPSLPLSKAPNPQMLFESLTNRECRILYLATQLLTNKEIVAWLFISPCTYFQNMKIFELHRQTG